LRKKVFRSEDELSELLKGINTYDVAGTVWQLGPAHLERLALAVPLGWKLLNLSQGCVVVERLHRRSVTDLFVLFALKAQSSLNCELILESHHFFAAGTLILSLKLTTLILTFTDAVNMLKTRLLMTLQHSTEPNRCL